MTMAFSKYSTVNRFETCLLGSKSQLEFHENGGRLHKFAGKQCAAIAAVALVTSVEEDPAMLTDKRLDRIVDEGHQLYCNIRSSGVKDNYLNADQVCGVAISGSSNQSFQLNLSHQQHAFSLQGVLDSQVYESNRNLSLEKCLEKFLSINCEHGLIFCRGYTYALVVKREWVFYIDSHPRNLRGHSVSDGKAVSVAFHKEAAAFGISRIINNNNDNHSSLERKRFKMTGNMENSLTFVIVPIIVKPCLQSSDHENPTDFPVDEPSNPAVKDERLPDPLVDSKLSGKEGKEKEKVSGKGEGEQLCGGMENQQEMNHSEKIYCSS